MRTSRSIVSAVGALGLAASLVVAAPPTTAGAATASGPPHWTELSPATSPSPRDAAAMAYDPATSQLILFGGNDGPGETWSWSGSTWTQLHPAVSPIPRIYAQMAYDPALREVVLFGGCDWRTANTCENGFELNDTWAWDGSDWNQLSPATSPRGRHGGAMAYDEATRQLVLFGGVAGYTSPVLTDTWIFDGSNWVQQFPVKRPAAGRTPAMAYDPATGQLVLYGGMTAASAFSHETWAWVGVNWHRVSLGSGPATSSGASMAYDRASRRLVLFGGQSQTGGYLDGTWMWGGARWSNVSTAVSPSPRATAAMAYDGATDQLVLFGGSGPGPYQGDTWVFSSR